MITGKKGDALSMNVVVIAILAVLVLVVVAIVFTGGVANAVQRMREFFNIGTGDSSLEFVKEQCRISCDGARLSSDPKDSSYCRREFDIRVDNEVRKYACWNKAGVSSAEVFCSGVVCV